VFPDEAMYVYDIDHGLRLIQKVDLPGITGIRGAVASPRTHMLYISHGGDGDGNGNGSMLAYDLLSNKVVWDRHYDHGIDSMAVSAAGSRIYMPDGELSSDGVWKVIDARSGSDIAQISGGTGPHNTIVGLSGKRVYLGGRNSPYLNVASTATNNVLKRVGPLESGVRPFTINGRETIAYTTATGFLGFQVSSLVSGRLLYTVKFGSRFGYDPAQFAPSAPSHGISLSPDERRVWVIDGPNSYVHVFDVSDVPRRAPRRIADIKLNNPLTGRESGCSYDCARDGWVQHSRSGCFVFVGDSGDVLSAATLRPVAFLPALRDSRKHIEIDWRGGVPIATTSRSGLGYVTRGQRPRPPAC
jgi:DNA-binding beta-propeller fold protein YncE